MNTHQVINGQDDIFLDGNPETVLHEFYYAFNTGNLALMTTNWLHCEKVSMSNPLGGVRRGWAEIEAVYQRIFNGEAEVYVEFYDYSIDQSDDFFCAVGRERGYFKNSEHKIELAIRTSRIYQKQEGIWRQLHHHGSIENPDLLKTYQAIVVQSTV